MYQQIADERIYVATGGQPFDPALPTVVFIPGSGLDHRSWAMQTRWFAFHGYSVLAPDFPGHSLSAGEPLEDIASMADWLWQIIDEQGVEQVVLIGHSQGGLVALEAANLHPERCRALCLVATGLTIPVNQQLIDAAKSSPPQAASAMLQWGFGQAHNFGCATVPGQAPIGIGAQIMQNNPLYEDLLACNDYASDSERLASLTMPAQLILARQDKMTPARSGRALAAALPNVQSIVELDGVGHMLPIEAPDRCLHELKQFISQLAE